MSAAAGTANQSVVRGACGAVAPDGDLERALERREHDQGVEPVPARERSRAGSRARTYSTPPGAASYLR